MRRTAAVDGIEHDDVRGALAAREGEDPVLEPSAIVTHRVAIVTHTLGLQPLARTHRVAPLTHGLQPLPGCSRVAARVGESPADAVALELFVHGEEQDLDAPAQGHGWDKGKGKGKGKG